MLEERGVLVDHTRCVAPEPFEERKTPAGAVAQQTPRESLTDSAPAAGVVGASPTNRDRSRRSEVPGVRELPRQGNSHRSDEVSARFTDQSRAGGRIPG